MFAHAETCTQEFGWRRVGTGRNFLRTRNSKLVEKFIEIHNRSLDGAGTDFAATLGRLDLEVVELSIEGFDNSLGLDEGIQADGRAVFDIDGGSDGNLTGLAEGLQRVKTCRLHEANHVRSGIDRRKLMMMCRERVVKLDAFFGDALGADGDLFWHDG